MARIRLRATLAGALLFAVPFPALPISEVNLGDLRLSGARGVPAERDHQYQFVGYLQARWSSRSGLSSSSRVVTFWVAGVGKWDGGTFEAEELLGLENAGRKDGSIVRRYRCNADPWLDARARCEVREVLASPPGDTDLYEIAHWMPQRPLSSGVVTLDQAAALSRNAPSAPPPPPAPATSPPRLSQAPSAAKASPPAGVLPRLQAPAGGGSAAATGVRLPRPDLEVGGVRAEVVDTCKPGGPVVQVHVDVRNAGAGPFPALDGVYTVYVREVGSGVGLTGGTAIRGLGSGETIDTGLDLRYARSPSELAGTTRRFEVLLNPLRHVEEADHGNNVRAFAVTFPPGYCGAKSIRPMPVQKLQVKPGLSTPGGERSLRPQPEPPGAPQR